MSDKIDTRLPLAKAWEAAAQEQGQLRAEVERWKIATTYERERADRAIARAVAAEAENNLHRNLAEQRAQEIARLEQTLAEYRETFGVWSR